MDANLIIQNFNNKIKNSDQKKLLQYLKKINKLEWPKFLKSFKNNYKYSYNKKFINKYKSIRNINIIGMGGSSLGAKAIYSFLSNKIKKKFNFYENLNLKKNYI